jgi:ribonuclease M5
MNVNRDAAPDKDKSAKPRVREIIVVEGRYDKNAVAQAVDALIVETRGFGTFSDPEIVSMLRRLGEKRGIVIMTDGDGAGFLIRGHLKSALAGLEVKHAYVPDVEGREKRRRKPSKAGLLGVEGMSSEIIISSLRQCGASFEGERAGQKRESVTKIDFYELGLTGARDSAARRARLLAKLGLPALLKTNALLRAVNALYSREEFSAAASAADERGE